MNEIINNNFNNSHFENHIPNHNQNINHNINHNSHYMFDSFLIKEFFDTVKEGNLDQIQNFIGIYYINLHININQ